MKTKIYNPCAGTLIETACKEAQAIAINEGCHVEFNFNGVELVATPQTSPSQLLSEWRDEQNKSREKYLKSPEYKALSLKKEMSSLIRKLPEILELKDLDMTICWIMNYANIADDTRSNAPIKTVLRFLKEYEFTENYGVGEKPAWFNTRERMGRYIIGQVISCAKIGMPPHPSITARFCNDYFTLSP